MTSYIIPEIQIVVNIRPVACSRSPVGFLGVSWTSYPIERKRPQRATRRPTWAQTRKRPWMLSKVSPVSCAFLVEVRSAHGEQGGGELLGVGLAVDVIGEFLDVGAVVHGISSLIFGRGPWYNVRDPLVGWLGFLCLALVGADTRGLFHALMGCTWDAPK